MSETPENTPQATVEALQNEVDRLRGKNAELLAELKAAKATAGDASATLEALQAERDAALADVRALRLDAPVASLLSDITLDADLFGQLFARHYQFTLDDNGSIVITDAEGNVPNVKEPDAVRTGGNPRHERPQEHRTPGKVRPAMFTPEDIALLAEATPDREKFQRLLLGTKAQGGDAPGTGRSVHHSMPAQPAAKPTDAPSAQPFGLR